jgi:hypothetical protein
MRKRKVCGCAKRRARVAVEHDRVHRRGLRQRRAQRPGGQAARVAGAALVEHRDLDAAGEPRVLQPVVADHDVDLRMRGQQRRYRLRTLARRRHRAAGASRQQHGFVAVLDRVVVGADQASIAASRAVAAGDDARRPAALHERFGERHDERRLAGAAGNEIADDDDRDRGRGEPPNVASPALRDRRGQRGERRHRRAQQPLGSRRGTLVPEGAQRRLESLAQPAGARGRFCLPRRRGHRAVSGSAAAGRRRRHRPARRR